VKPSAALRCAACAVSAVALLSALSSVPVRAQSEPAPAPPAADTAAVPVSPVADTAAVPAPTTGKAAKVKKVKAPKTPAKPYAERRAEDGIYAQGSNWLSLRLGYAKRSGDLSGQGLIGYGMSWQRMLSKRYAFAAGAGEDVVGHFSQHVDIAVPFTAEFQRHFLWKSAARPYVGLGGGYYFRKNYRTLSEYNTHTTGGVHVTVGFNSALGDRHAIGIEARGARLKGRKGITNPTFGTSEDSETLWTVKGTWSLSY
jgi:hypothetical protein